MVDSSKIKRADEQYIFIAGEFSTKVLGGKATTLQVTDGIFNPIKTYNSKQL